MKVKVISFVLVLLMVISIMPLTVFATYIAPPIMCDHAHSSTHKETWGYCNFCDTYVCATCHPKHLHTSTSLCPTHKLNYVYCSTCNAWLCPSEHTHATTPNYGYCNTHKINYKYCSVCDAWHCPSENSHHAVQPQYGYCNTHGVYYTYCSTCNAWHCPSEFSNHATAPQYVYCNKHTTLVAYVLCSACNAYYCPTCYGGYHSHTGGSTVIFWCASHKTYSSYCETCKVYYCAGCNGGVHKHVVQTTPTCEAPTANIPNNSRVESGTKVALSTETSGAIIYYTTDKSIPTAQSNRYTGPITLTKDTTIIAIAVKNGMVKSSTSSYKYTIRAKVSFTDISDYPGLSNTLSILLDEKVITDSQSFNPSESFTLAELKVWLGKIGVSFDKVSGIDQFDDDDVLTYNDFVYITYKALLKADYIKSPKGSGYNILKKFTYNKDIVNASFYKAGFVSFYENALFYDVSFKPDSEATRLYLATAIAAVIVNNNL